MRLLTSPWSNAFDELVTAAEHELLISSPFIGRQPVDRVITTANRFGRSDSLRLNLLVDLSCDNLVTRATDPDALVHLVRSLPHTTIRFIPSIHAKVYVADSKAAIITSANMTAAGLLRNMEYGVHLNDLGLVAQIKSDLADYADLGVPIRLDELERLAGNAAQIRAIHLRAQATIQRSIAREFERCNQEIVDGLVRLRLAGRTPSEIFANTILYLLRRGGPMPTATLHPQIQRIHPDLCDDTVDRVIDGRHFGKKWKHAVRSAQQLLKARNQITFSNEMWSLTEADRRYRDERTG